PARPPRGYDRPGGDPDAPGAGAQPDQGAGRHRASRRGAWQAGVHSHRGAADVTSSSAWGGLIAHYRDRLPIKLGDRVVTLNDGNTPLVRTDRLAAVV